MLSKEVAIGDWGRNTIPLARPKEKIKKALLLGEHIDKKLLMDDN